MSIQTPPPPPPPRRDGEAPRSAEYVKAPSPPEAPIPPPCREVKDPMNAISWLLIVAFVGYAFILPLLILF